MTVNPWIAEAAGLMVSAALAPAPVSSSPSSPAPAGSTTRPDGSVVQTQVAGAGDVAAMNYLSTRGQVAQVAFTVPDNHSPLDTYAAMRDAMISVFGRITSASSPYPTGLTYDQLADVCDAWAAAAVAGAQASPDFLNPLASSNALSQYNDVTSWRAYLAIGVTTTPAWTGATATDDDIESTFDRVLRLAQQLEALDFVTADARPAGWTWSEVPGTLASAGLGAVGSVLGGGAEAIAGALLSSPIVWAAALGYIAWRYAR